MTILFFILGAVFIFIPYMPSLFEIKKATDAAALRITTHILKDPRSEPELIFWQMVRALGLHGLENLRQSATVTSPTSLSSDILAIPGGQTQKPPRGTARMISAAPIELSDKTSYSSKILSFHSITTGAEDLLNEIHSADTLIIKNKSKVYWWATGKTVLVEKDVKLPGKTQAKEKIQFQSSAHFQLLEAPLIESKTKMLPLPVSTSIPTAFQNAQKLTRTDSSYSVQSGTTQKSTFIIHGDLVIEKDATVQGDVKARGKIVLEVGAQVLGNLISDSEILFRGQNFVSGTVLAKKAISTAPHLQIGTPDHPVTLSGETILLRGAFKIHGMVRAWKTGVVKES